jgi:hypothetical protein
VATFQTLDDPVATASVPRDTRGGGTLPPVARKSLLAIFGVH